MKLSTEEVRAIAKLARLSISEEEVEQYQKDLSSILSYVQKLQKAKTNGVEEMAHPSNLENIFREDVVDQCDEATRMRIIDSFPMKEGSLLEVQAVFKSKNDYDES